MDPISLGVNAGVSLLLGLISLVVYHRWGPSKAPAMPALPAPAPTPSPLASPLLHLAVSHGVDVLNQLASGAVKSGVSQIVLPALVKVLQQTMATLEQPASPAAPAPAVPTK